MKTFVKTFRGKISHERIDTYVNLGVDKVILGSAAIKDPSFLEEACKKFNGKIALGIDVKKTDDPAHRHLRGAPQPKATSDLQLGQRD